MCATLRLNSWAVDFCGSRWFFFVVAKNGLARGAREVVEKGELFVTH